MDTIITSKQETKSDQKLVHVMKFQAISRGLPLAFSVKNSFPWNLQENYIESMLSKLKLDQRIQQQIAEQQIIANNSSNGYFNGDEVLQTCALCLYFDVELIWLIKIDKESWMKTLCKYRCINNIKKSTLYLELLTCLWMLNHKVMNTDETLFRTR